MTDGMKNLALDRWYKVIIWLGGAGLILSLTAPLQIPNLSVFLMSSGAVCFGIGQWINHPIQSHVVGIYKVTNRTRKTSVGGVVAEVLGVAVFCCGLFKLWPVLVA